MKKKKTNITPLLNFHSFYSVALFMFGLGKLKKYKQKIHFWPLAPNQVFSKFAIIDRSWILAVVAASSLISVEFADEEF